jgi:hypothetical protein
VSLSKRTALAAIATVGLLSLPEGSASAAEPSPFFNGFETDTSGWFEDEERLSTLHQEQSGYTDDGGYANEIASASGDYHARLGVLDCSRPCLGPYTEWSGPADTFPPGGFATGIAIYLDVDWAASHPDVRFDWDVAINDAKGEPLHDFAFSAGTSPEGSQGNPGFLINASTDALPQPPREQMRIGASGWYTFVHRFSDGGVSGLRVEMSILDSSGNAVADWTVDPGDPIAAVGGNGDGRFSNQEIDELPIDNSSLQLLGNTPTPETPTTSEPTEAFLTGPLSLGPALQPSGGSSAALNPPVFGRTVTVQVVSGTVRVRVPGSRRFRVLKAGERIPVGSIVDATHGRVRLTTAKYREGSETQTADFYAGVFRVLQPPLGRPRTVLKLVDEFGRQRLGPRIALASRRRHGGRKGRRSNGLWGDGKGNFVSRGKHGSATVRGTVWFTQDRPDGTFFKVRENTVLVRDFTRRRTVRLRAGQSYLAPAP